jgi:putative hydrolase of the HAD superfamily
MKVAPFARSVGASRPVRAVLFDFGGTLVSNLRDPYPIWEEVVRAHETSLDRGTFERAFEKVDHQLGPFLDRYLGAPPGIVGEYDARGLEYLGIGDPTGQILRDLHEAFTAPRWHRPYPETEEVLDQLARRGLSLHVVSNNTELLPETLRRLGWSERFSTVTYSQEAGAEKPDPRVFRLSLDRARCSADEAVHVGNSWEADYLGAKRAGLRAIWLNRSGEDPPEPCETVRDLRELDRQLNRK